VVDIRGGHPQAAGGNNAMVRFLFRSKKGKRGSLYKITGLAGIGN